MKRLVITGVSTAATLDDGRDAFVQIETNEGALELRFTYQDAERLIAAVHAARRQVQTERAHDGKPPLPRRDKAVVQWETALDPIDQNAVLVAHFADQSVQETRIARGDLKPIAQFLQETARRFESSADLRQ